jgi:hypothetical protein
LFDAAKIAFPPDVRKGNGVKETKIVFLSPGRGKNKAPKGSAWEVRTGQERYQSIVFIWDYNWMAARASGPLFSLKKTCISWEGKGIWAY